MKVQLSELYGILKKYVSLFTVLHQFYVLIYLTKPLASELYTLVT